jgi:hypothetical protein
MVTATIQADLRADNFLVVCAALQAACRAAAPELVSVFLPAVVGLLRHDRDAVKRWALLALQRFVQVDASCGPEVERHLVEKLGHREPGVMAAALAGLAALVARGPVPYRGLAPYFVNILKQAAEGKLGRAWEVRRAPAPFLQIALLRLLAALCAGEGGGATAAGCAAVVAEAWRRAEALGGGVGDALVVECARTAAALITADPERADALDGLAAHSVGRLLAARDNNQRYAGIDALARLAAAPGGAVRAARHQLAAVACLRSPDATLKRRTLDLLFAMAGPHNVALVAAEVLAFLREPGGEPGARAHAAAQLADAARRLAPDARWRAATLAELLDAAGDEAAPPGGADELADALAGAPPAERAEAAAALLEVLDRPKAPAALLLAALRVAGELGPQGGADKAALADAGAAAAEARPGAGEVQAAAVEALARLGARAGRPAAGAAAAFLAAAARAADVGLAQAAAEALALADAPGAARAAAAAPPPAAIDAALPFLDGFVAAAAQAGAAPYLSLEDRIAMGVSRPRPADPFFVGGDGGGAPSTPGRSPGGGGALKFAAYAVSSAPTASPVVPPSASATAPPAAAASLGFEDLDFLGMGAAERLPSSSPSPAAAAAALAPASAARPLAEPQIVVSRPGRKWGPGAAAAPSPPPAASPSPPAAVAPSPPQQQHRSSSSGCGGGRRAEPVDPAAAALAASLFGGGGGGAAPPPRAAPAPTPAADLLGDMLSSLDAPAQAQAPAANVFDLLGSGGGTNGGAAPQDAMAALSGLSLGGVGAPPPPPAHRPGADPFEGLM